MTAISVIIPIYNVEKYLEKALESLMYQTFKDIEIICVDDGSTDNSGYICERMARTDSRIKVIHQENQRAGASRNAGMALATGKYIGFMDGDDWLHPNFLEVLFRLCEDNKCDIAQCGFDMVWSERGIIAADYCEAVIVKGTDMALRNYLSVDGWRNIVVWNKLYRREWLIKLNVKFPYGKWHEDEYFTYKALYNADSVAITECPLYYYRQRSDSFMGIGFTLDKALDRIEAFKEKAEFYKNEDALLFFQANLKLQGDYYYALKELEKRTPVKEGIINYLQDGLKSVRSSVKSLDSETMREMSLDKLRIRNLRDSARQCFNLENEYNKNSRFKSGIREISGKAIQPKVSVCIPVYNVAQVLSACLNSVLNQTLAEIEIICVEDASTDKSKEILEAYAVRDSRVRIICHEKNLGTLASRKNAVMAAQGKYIMFVDSDDELLPHACKTAYEVIEQNQTDMAEFGAYAMDPSGKVKQINSLITEDIDRLEGPNLLHLKMKKKLKNWQVWNKIYRSDIFKKAFCDIKDEYSVLADDFRIFCVFGYYAHSVSLIKEKLYKWKWGYGIWSGIPTVIDLNRYKKLLTEKDDWDAVAEFINSKSDKAGYQDFLQEIHSHFLQQGITWWNNSLEEKDKSEGFRLYAEKWGTVDTATALQWLLSQMKLENTSAEKQITKLQKENKVLRKEKSDLLRSKAELDKIKNSNGYKALKKYYKVRNVFFKK